VFSAKVGRIKSTPEDFVVQELPAYLPSGQGEHLYLRFTKRDRTTDDAVRAICGALGVSLRDAGVAGLKDKVAVTTQWMSVLAKDTSLDARASGLALDGITIHEARRHTNKLKTGHLAGNRFEIVVRGEGLGGALAELERIGREGLPNAFGPQRFGKFGDNADRAKKWIMGEAPAPRDARLRRLHWSALQSAVFNAVLEARVSEGTWCEPMEGDLLKVESPAEGPARNVSPGARSPDRQRGGLFVCTDVQTDRERTARGEVCPTGPIVGVKMRAPGGRAAEIERACAARILGDSFDLGRTGTLGEGSRRILRLHVRDMLAVEQADGVRVYFVLPKGAYATTVLGAAFRLEFAPDVLTIDTAEPDAP
jgi:tRNA pseudouridine13 synthase